MTETKMTETKALTLYDIEENLQALLDTEAMTEGDEEAHLQILDEIAQAGKAAVAKRDNTIRFLRHLDLQQFSIKTEIGRLNKLSDSYAKGQARVEKYVVALIEKCVPEPKRGAKRLEGTIGVMSLRKGTDTAVVEDAAVIPPAYKDVAVKLSGTDFARLIAILSCAREPTMAEAMEDSHVDIPHPLEIRKALKAGKDVAGADLTYGASTLVVK